MTAVNPEPEPQAVCESRDTPNPAATPAECVTLHVAAGFPVAKDAGNNLVAAPANEALRIDTDSANPGFVVLEAGCGTYVLSGVIGSVNISINDVGEARLSQGSRETATILVLHRHSSIELKLPPGARVSVKATELNGWPIRFTGGGQVDITGVHVTPTEYAGRRLRFATASPDVSLAMKPHNRQVSILVNSSEADAIKASWVYLERAGVEADSGSGRDYAQVLGKVELALRYVAFLNSGGRAFDDFIAHIELDANGEPAWEQTFHDNLLGELNTSILRARLIHNSHPVPEELALTREGLFELYTGFAGSIAERPYCAGRFRGEADADCAPLAFDFSQGWSRSDYLWRSPDQRLTRAAIS